MVEDPMSSTPEKSAEPAIELRETVNDGQQTVSSKPFWQSPLFIGSYLAMSLGVTGYYTGFAMPSNTLSIINADIGPSADITWVSTCFTLTAAISSTIVGRLSDIFGRRYFFVAGSMLALIGSIVASTSQTVNQLIGATALIGLGSGTQSSYVYVIAEIVPYKHRALMIGLINILTVPASAFGPLVARAFILHTSATWRWNYYFAIILNGCSTILWFTCYFPPRFETLHRNRSRWQQLLKVDFIGMLLFSGGMLLFLLGISWGGNQYAWNSAHVIATIVVGAVMLIAFILFEIYSGIDEPFIPLSSFKNIQFDVIVLLSVVGGMVYYSSAVIYPTLIQIFYTTDIFRVGVLTCAPTAGTCFGLFAGGLVCEKIGHLKMQYIFSACALTAFTAGLAAANASNQDLATAFGVLGGFFVGYLELLTESTSTIVLSDQMLLGSSIGVLNTLRTASGTIATTIYVSILTNTVSAKMTSVFVPAVVRAGLPTNMVERFVAAFTSGSETAIANFPGVTPELLRTATTAYQACYSAGFRKVFLTSIAFGGCAIVASLLYRDIKPEVMERGVVVHLQRPTREETVIVQGAPDKEE
ncbi:hypothetical protein AYO20_01293 [Fonsecaea nubica]|uniref:Major facilitator superfamily (MFS) profile domain-containing protein n=1 Tax=Fonsecaea nubica TaxID=856822 RepID=A0A178DDX8_9EURO|nr:hypothetical protein AYO20_01293 [Fonsecaea nubica]OAL39423.1 hypothetical protein AYO20_01293 [Fonsecaea nubica]